MEWISVTERFPNDGQDCLCIDNSNGRQSIHILTYYKIHRDDLNKLSYNAFWDYDSDWGNYKFNDITHWCALPELPRQD